MDVQRGLGYTLRGDATSQVEVLVRGVPPEETWAAQEALGTVEKEEDMVPTGSIDGREGVGDVSLVCEGRPPLSRVRSSLPHLFVYKHSPNSSLDLVSCSYRRRWGYHLGDGGSWRATNEDKCPPCYRGMCSSETSI